MLCQNLPVTGCLVEHIDEVGVFEDILNLTAAQKVFDVLGDAGGDAAPFTETLPDLDAVGCGLFFLQKQVELVNVVPRGLMCCPVDGDAVPHLILDDQHTDLLQLFAQLLDVITDNAAVDVHIGPVVEHIQRTGNVDFQSGGNKLGFLFFLLPEGIVKTLQNGHILRLGIVEVVLVDQPHTAVNDSLFNRSKAVLTADDQFTEGQDEVRLQGQGVIFVTVIQVQIQRIQITGFAVVTLAGGRKFNGLTIEPLHQGLVFCFGIADEDVIIRDQEGIGNLSLGREGLTAAGCTQDQTVGVLQLLPVNHDQIVGQGVDSVVQRTLMALEQFLSGKRNEDGNTGGSQAALDLNLVEAQRQAADHAFFLLIIQSGDVAVVLLGDGIGLEDVIVQLPLGVCGIQNQEGNQEHSLVPTLEACQQLLCFGTVGGKVRGNDVHVITGTDSFLLFLNLGLVQIGDGSLNGLDGADLIHGLNMEIHNDVALNIQEILQNTVTEFRSQNLQKADGGKLLAHPEIFCPVEQEGAGGNEVLGGQAGSGKPVPGKIKRLKAVHAENVMENFEPVMAVQHFRCNAQSFEVVDNIRFDPLQTGLGNPDVICIDAKGQVLGFHNTVVALGKLVLQHPGLFVTNSVESILLGRDRDGLSKGFFRCGQIDKGQLKLNGAVKVVQEITPAIEDGLLILIIGKLVVDVPELNHLGVMGLRNLTDTIHSHSDIRDAILG